MIEVKEVGSEAVAEALKRYAECMRRDVMNGVRQAAAYAADSLQARTRQPHGTGAHPKFRRATAADIAELRNARWLPPALMHMPPDVLLKWIETESADPEKARWHGRPMVGMRDHTGRSPYKPSGKWLVGAKVSDLNRIYRYRRIGLAKASWKWASRKAKKRAAAERNQEIAPVVERHMAVYADEQAKSVRITNRLNYIIQAMDGGYNAVQDALRAAGNRLMHWIDEHHDAHAKEAGLR